MDDKQKEFADRLAHMTERQALLAIELRKARQQMLDKDVEGALMTMMAVLDTIVSEVI